jgi:hypothetical protein
MARYKYTPPDKKTPIVKKSKSPTLTSDWIFSMLKTISKRKKVNI